MGCFDYTCAITGVSIKHGDPVLHVVVINKYKEELNDIISFINEYENYMPDGAMRFAKRYLPVEEHAAYVEKELKSAIDREMMINFGTYNDYGWIYEVDRGDIHPMDVLNFMVKREVVDRIFAESGEAGELTPFLALTIVTRFMWHCRINPFKLTSGAQHYNQEEHTAHLLRIELIKDALGRKEQYWRDLDDELEEEED